MVPKRFEHYLFNDNDYLPEQYEVADKEREELIRQLAAMIADDLQLSGKPKRSGFLAAGQSAYDRRNKVHAEL